MNTESTKQIEEVLLCTVQSVRVCIEIKYVYKILELIQHEPLPNGPDYLVGLFNLAGTSIPIFDLTSLIGLKRTHDYSLDTPIVICSNDKKMVGIIVDDIKEIASVDERSIQLQNDFKENTSQFNAVITIDSDLSLMINPNFIFSLDLVQNNINFKADNNLINEALEKHE